MKARSIFALFLPFMLMACASNPVIVTDTVYDGFGNIIRTTTHNMSADDYIQQQNIENSAKETKVFYEKRENMLTGLNGTEKAMAIMALALSGEKRPTNYNDYLIVKEQESTKRVGEWMGLGKKVIGTTGMVVGAKIITDGIVDISQASGTKIETAGDVNYVESQGTLNQNPVTTTESYNESIPETAE